MTTKLEGLGDRATKKNTFFAASLSQTCYFSWYGKRVPDPVLDGLGPDPTFKQIPQLIKQKRLLIPIQADML